MLYSHDGRNCVVAMDLAQVKFGNVLKVNGLVQLSAAWLAVNLAYFLGIVVDVRTCSSE